MPKREFKFRYNYAFYRQPVSVQVIFKRIQLLVDKYCKIDKAGDISYTTKAEPTTLKILPRAESIRIFNDLYGEQDNES